MNSSELKVKLMEVDEYGDAGFNEGAATWIMERVEAGKETAEQALFRRMNYRGMARVNAEYADYAPVALPAGVEVVFVGNQPDNTADAYSVRQDGAEVARIAGRQAAMEHAATLTDGWAIPGGGSIAALRAQREVGDTLIDTAYSLLYENMTARNRHDAAQFVVQGMRQKAQTKESLAALAAYVGVKTEIIEEVYRLAVLSLI